APARPQGSLAVIFVWRGEIYSAHAEAAAGGNFDTVFNRMFSAVNEFFRPVSGPNLPPPPPTADPNPRPKFFLEGTTHPKKPFCNADLRKGLFSPFSRRTLRWNRSWSKSLRPRWRSVRSRPRRMR